ncbi:MAG: ubiquitin carboxyl-terminal hydrolase [archaeon]|nr:ubiquitin carboxyl-terminal hydrolase [archaeon]
MSLKSLSVSKYPQKRYLIPSKWIDDLIKAAAVTGNSKTNKKVDKKIFNESFISENEYETKLNPNFNRGDAYFVIYEIMKKINDSLFQIDTIIEVDYDYNRNTIDLSVDINTMSQDQFKKYAPEQTSYKEQVTAYIPGNKIKYITPKIEKEDKTKDKITETPLEEEDKNNYSKEVLKENTEEDLKEEDQKDPPKKLKKKKHSSQSKIKNKSKSPLKEHKKNKSINKIDSEGQDDLSTMSNTVTKKKNKETDSNIKTYKSKPSKNISTVISTKTSTINSSFLTNLNDFCSQDVSPKGLNNPSVYCFMNTCLQCIISIPELNYYLTTGKYKNEAKYSPKYCEKLAEFIKDYKEAEDTLNPRKIIKVCNSLLPSGEQHDCHEFLCRLIGKIQEELNQKKKYTFPDGVNLKKAWTIYNEVNSSFVDKILTGMLRSSVTCCKCRHESYTYDPFTYLTLQLNSRRDKDTLKNCLNVYFETEKIDCDYKCEACRKTTSVK